MNEVGAEGSEAAEQDSTSAYPEFDDKPTRARKSPQQRKGESYEKDRRAIFDASDKGRRKTLPRAKRRVARANRRITQQRLGEGTGNLDAIDSYAVQDRVQSKRPKKFVKTADQPLGVVLSWQQSRSWQLWVRYPDRVGMPSLPVRQIMRFGKGLVIIDFEPDVTQEQANQVAAWYRRKGVVVDALRFDAHDRHQDWRP